MAIGLSGKQENLFFRKPVSGELKGGSIFNVQSEFIFNKRNEFSRREVGLNHPDVESFIKLNDAGEIEIMAAPGVGIIINGPNRSVSIFADTLKIYTTEDDGIRWNKYAFNYAATDFTEPFLVTLKDFQQSPAYYGYEEKIGKIQSIKNATRNSGVTIQANYEYDAPTVSKSITLNVNEYYDENLSDDNLALLKKLEQQESPKVIEYIKELLYNGYTFNQARIKAKRDMGPDNA